MIIVADMGPLHYLVLIGAEQILPRLFTRVLTPPAVIAEMGHPDTPERVRQWAASPPEWLEIKEPAHIEDIPSLGKKGLRGAGEKTAIALAREEQSEAILMDDKTGRREARKRGLEPLWMLSILDDAAEQGLLTDLPQKLDQLEQSTSFYVSNECKRVIEDMKQRDRERRGS
jgi:predicted nucleic acid-binding protein